MATPLIDSLSVVGLAAAPIGELRFAIPWAVVELGMPWHRAFLLAVAGNLIPALTLPWLLKLAGERALNLPAPIGRLLRWRVERLRTSTGRRAARYGRWALLPLVAIPLPFTGAWTGCLAAWALDIHPRRSALPIAVGVLIAGVIVVILTELGVSLAVSLDS